jgi:hypothetical protein
LVISSLADPFSCAEPFSLNPDPKILLNPDPYPGPGFRYNCFTGGTKLKNWFDTKLRDCRGFESSD